jgi:hypothetical protein
MLRVTRRSVVLLTVDSDSADDYWSAHEADLAHRVAIWTREP